MQVGIFAYSVAHNISFLQSQESGLFGSLLAFAFGLIIFGCLKIAAKSADRFGAMIAVGVSVLLMTHMFVNVGMTIESLHYRFTAVFLATVLSCHMFLDDGVVQSVYRYRKEFR